MEFKLKTLTPIWTGGIDKHDRKLHLTGIKGSLRWWYEVLIRGLGFYACDPTDDSKKCELKLTNEDREALKTMPLIEIIKPKLCPACYLFGCTGWSGKFTIRIMKPASNIDVTSLYSEDKNEIPFEMHFVEKKKFDKSEEFLLKMTMKLIVDYGAIGGKTALKPSEKADKNRLSHPKRNHLDYGIINRDENSGIPTEQIYNDHNKVEIDKYLKSFDNPYFKKNTYWPNLKYFWFVTNEYIKRNEHNLIVERDDKGRYKNKDYGFQKFLGGYIPREGIIFKNKDQDKDKNVSKKIFSFHGIKPNAIITNNNVDNSQIIQQIRRCYGYVLDEDSLKEVMKLLNDNVKKDNSVEPRLSITCGDEIIEKFL